MHSLRSALNTDGAKTADSTLVPPMHRVSDSTQDRKGKRIHMRGECHARWCFVNGTRVEPRDFDGGDFACEFYIYDDAADWAGLASKFEDAEELLTVAEQMNRREWRDWIVRFTGEAPVEGQPLTEAQRSADGRYPGSVESEFRKIHGRTPRPLRKLAVVAKDVPAPQSNVEQHTHAQTKMLANLLAGSGIGGGGITPDAIAAAVKAALESMDSRGGNGGGNGRRG